MGDDVFHPHTSVRRELYARAGHLEICINGLENLAAGTTRDQQIHNLDEETMTPYV